MSEAVDALAWFKGITPGGVAMWGAFMTLVGIFVRQGPINRKLTQDREGNLLRERAKDMALMRKRIAQLEAEQRINNHTISNLEQCLDSLLMMIEMNPERAAEAAVRVRAMREGMKVQQATEKAGVYAGTISGAATIDDDGEEPQS